MSCDSTSILSRSQHEDLCVVYNLSQGIDVEDMQQKLAAYQKANSYSILQNQALKVQISPLSLGAG